MSDPIRKTISVREFITQLEQYPDDHVVGIFDVMGYLQNPTIIPQVTEQQDFPLDKTVAIAPGLISDRFQRPERWPGVHVPSSSKM